ncbi:UNVERIFIED_CONTAM: Transmembrane 9 superfamily member 5 [Sesamum angustifolium]|uniref:Transmembrane 9 superfamily member n=1 Tax=Sesamum angustifolium TaxID=2727405 RepID=A0AAW2QNR3_9LAMI
MVNVRPFDWIEQVTMELEPTYAVYGSYQVKHTNTMSWPSVIQVLEEKESLGEVLNGDSEQNWCSSCQKLNSERLQNSGMLTYNFYYQMYYDDLPLWAFIGKFEEGNWTDDGKGPKYFLFTHVQFDALYNGNQVIEIHAFSDPSHAIDVTEDVDVKVDFTYSVSWKRTATPYKNRMDRYSAASLLPILQKTHWFSFVNSIVIVILLMGLLTVLFMRHLKNDIRKWSIGDEDEEKEVGWKYIHGDVFRCPRNLPLFSAILGSGTQLLSMVLILFVLAFLGVFHPYSRGTLSSSILISYILTTVVAGYSSASFCSQYAETGWERSALLAGILFSGPFLLTAFFLNILAAYFNVTTALPLGTILLIFLIYTLVAIPLLVLGGVVGHRYKSDLQSFPVTKKCPREIPSLSWSVLRGGSTAIFMFSYCTYFYLKSNMSGILQAAFFFGYSACMCYAFFLMLGTVSFQASLLFVRRIYHAVKSE